MKPSEIIKLARRQTGCTEDIVTTDEAYRFLNFVIEDFGADIRASDSWYWFDFLNVDVEAGQSQYTIDDDPGGWFDKFPIWKLEKVWYRLSDWKWRDLPIRFVDKIDINDRPNQWAPEICFILNNTIQLIPEPKEATQMMIWGYDYNWELWDIPAIEVNWAMCWRNEPADLWVWKTYKYAWSGASGTFYTQHTGWDTSCYEYDASAWTYWPAIWCVYYENWYDREENIFIPKRWHYILVEWLKYRMYGNMWVNFETARTNSRNFYDSEKMKALQNIMDRWQESDEPYFPELNFLNY